MRADCRSRGDSAANGLDDDFVADCCYTDGVGASAIEFIDEDSSANGLEGDSSANGFVDFIDCLAAAFGASANGLLEVDSSANGLVAFDDFLTDAFGASANGLEDASNSAKGFLDDCRADPELTDSATAAAPDEEETAVSILA